MGPRFEQCQFNCRDCLVYRLDYLIYGKPTKHRAHQKEFSGMISTSFCSVFRGAEVMGAETMVKSARTVTTAVLSTPPDHMSIVSVVMAVPQHL